MKQVDALHEIFSDITSYRELQAGERLFRRGDRTDALFSVVTGRLRMLRDTSDGRTVTLHIARPGEILAEAALFAETYHCDAVADLPSRLIAYGKRAFLDKLQNDPEVALSFIALQAQRIQGLRTQLELRNVRSAKERVLQYLLLSADSASGILPLDRPLKEMASDIGLTHEAFYRALAELEKAGDVVRSDRVMRIKI